MCVDPTTTGSFDCQICSARTTKMFDDSKNVPQTLADDIFTKNRVENAVRSFQSYNSAERDGMIPAMLQNDEYF